MHPTAVSENNSEGILFVGYYTIPFGLGSFGTFWHYFSPFSTSLFWLRITDEGSIPEMRIWSILLIISDLKWCIHLSRSLYLYLLTNESQPSQYSSILYYLIGVRNRCRFTRQTLMLLMRDSEFKKTKVHGCFILAKSYRKLSSTSIQLFELLCLAKDHWRGFCTRNAHMVHFVN